MGISNVVKRYWVNECMCMYMSLMVVACQVFICGTVCSQELFLMTKTAVEIFWRSTRALPSAIFYLVFSLRHRRNNHRDRGRLVP